MDFEVDFYGRGKHPPHALHSEGHQDSMGVCLYLALAEKLAAGIIDLIVLDDVVMSVDADHRRGVCNILASSFPGRQFLITTHDKTWATQLRSEGVVDSKRTMHFFNWHVATGPVVDNEVDMWQRIEEDLEHSNIEGAAHRLRRGSEQFFATVCDMLQAPVKYRLDGRWELGDYLPAAIGRYRDLLKQAKKAAQSWGDKERFDKLQEYESVAATVFSRSQVEQWAINANVHYNSWASFSEKDFRPVVEAFQNLHQLFVCTTCHGHLRLVTAGIAPSAVRCTCGGVDWNLADKGSTN